MRGAQEEGGVRATATHEKIRGKLDGTITSWNAAAARMYGLSSDEVIGSSELINSAEGRAGETHAILARIEAGEQVEPIETTRLRKDGTRIKVSLTYSPIRHPDGTVVGVSTIARDLTYQEEAFAAAQQMASIIENSGEAIMGSTLDGIITSWNPAAERLFGYTRQEMVGQHGCLISPDGRAEVMHTNMAKINAGGQVERFEATRVRKDGAEIPVLLTISPICDPDGTIVGVSTIARDLTEHRRAVQNANSLTAAEDLVSTVMGSAAIGIALTGLDGVFRVVNRSLCDLLGRDETWFLTRQIRDMVHPDDVEAVLQERDRFMARSSKKSVGSLRLVRADGATVWVRHVVVLVLGEDGQPNLLMVQVEDITAEHEAQEALAYQAIHDPLTGLHNRAWILDILKADLLAARRLGTSVGTLFIDLDNFKVVNDSLGHAAGDEVLTTVADRIVAGLRPGDRVGRFGGDEFVIVVQDVQDVVEIEHCAERVSASIAADLQVRGHRIVPTASIGIALSTPASTPESLLRDTDCALSRAKTAGRARWQFFDDAMHAQAVARLTVEDQLRDAITRCEFQVHYQPIVALADAHVVGHEALVRWAHPTRGLLNPGEFLDVAEDSGLITAIGAQVVDQVCALLAQRPDLPGPISVNVSAVQLAAPGWLNSVTGSLARHRVDPARIVIELTETAALSLTDSALHALESLIGLAVGTHLADFGTASSSLSVLRDPPLTASTLDLPFVHALIPATPPPPPVRFLTLCPVPFSRGFPLVSGKPVFWRSALR